MAVFFSLVLPILAGISFIAIFIFLFRAISARSNMSSQAYGVGQVETRQKVRANLLGGLIALLFALVFLALSLAGPRVLASLPEPTPTPRPTAVPATAVPTETTTVTPLPTSSLATPTSPVPTTTSTAVPIDTPTPSPLTASVSSGVGIYLRSEPGTSSTELQYLEDGTVLFVLEGLQVADELQWQQVRTDTGQVGWVAVDFITVNEP